MESDGKPKAWCVGFFGKCSKACISLSSAADADIITNYILDDGGVVPEAGALPPTNKLQGRSTKRNLRGLNRGIPDLQSGCFPTYGGGVK